MAWIERRRWWVMCEKTAAANFAAAGQAGAPVPTWPQAKQAKAPVPTWPQAGTGKGGRPYVGYFLRWRIFTSKLTTPFWSRVPTMETFLRT